MGQKRKAILRSVELMVEQLEGRRFLSVGDLVPSGFGGGVAPTPLTETTVTQGSQTLTITGNAIERLNSDSSVDTTFGTAGETNLSFTPLAIGLDQSGNILVAGLSGTNLEVTRMDANGTIDGTYGTMGTATVALSGSDTYAGTELAINSSGDVTLLTQATASGGVVQGDGTTSFVELARLDDTGNIDTTYGTNGFDSIQNAVGTNFTLMSDGGLVLSSQEVPTGDGSSTTDANFVDTSGTVTELNSVNGTNTAIEVATGINGDYYLFSVADRTYTIQHFNDATLDTTFGKAGTVNISHWLGYNVSGVSSVGVDTVNGVEVCSDGELLIAYEANLANVTTAPAAAMLNANGSVDDSFGTDGFVLLSVGNTEFTPAGSNALTILDNGDFTISGVDGNNDPATQTFQGVDRDVNPVASDVSFAASIGLKYAYVTVEYDAGQTPLTSDQLIDQSLIVVSGTGIQAAANLSSVTGGNGDPLEATYVFRIDHRALLRPDNGLYQFIVLGDAVVDGYDRGSAGGMAEYSLYIAPRNRGQAILSQVFGPSVSAANIRPEIQVGGNGLVAQDQPILAD